MFNLEIFLSGKQYFYNFEMHSIMGAFLCMLAKALPKSNLNISDLSGHYHRRNFCCCLKWEIKQSTKLDKMFGLNFFMTDWYFLTFVVQS